MGDRVIQLMPFNCGGFKFWKQDSTGMKEFILMFFKLEASFWSCFAAGSVNFDLRVTKLACLASVRCLL